MANGEENKVNNINPITVLTTGVDLTPLVLDSPHSGCKYPADFHFVCPLSLLRQTEDAYVDELIAGATQIGAEVLVAEFPRSYIDVNRAENDIDPSILSDEWPETLHPSERTLLGLGLVRRLCKSGVPVYPSGLAAHEIEYRIINYYRPYHATLEAMISKRMSRFGEAYLINCHSMPDRSSEKRLLARPDFVLGDRGSTSCDVSFTRFAYNVLRDMGYRVALNDPYQGVEIVRRYGQPQRRQHALQLEINRRLYMNEQTLEKTSGFVSLQRDLLDFFRIITAEIQSRLSDADRQAAE